MKLKLWGLVLTNKQKMKQTDRWMTNAFVFALGPND